eukprot:scaffold98_cov244-Pinguiococcus_pyrenoidosus.AAC.10
MDIAEDVHGRLKRDHPLLALEYRIDELADAENVVREVDRAQMLHVIQGLGEDLNHSLREGIVPRNGRVRDDRGGRDGSGAAQPDFVRRSIVVDRVRKHVERMLPLRNAVLPRSQSPVVLLELPHLRLELPDQIRASGGRRARPVPGTRGALHDGRAHVPCGRLRCGCLDFHGSQTLSEGLRGLDQEKKTLASKASTPDDTPAMVVLRLTRTNGQGRTAPKSAPSRVRASSFGNRCSTDVDDKNVPSTLKYEYSLIVYKLDIFK